MEELVNVVQQLIDPEKLIVLGGVTLILFVIFAENGIFFCFFFPGDTLLFTTGILCSTGFIATNILLLTGSVWLAAILGNLFGYFFGRKVGERLFKKKDSLLFKKKYIYSAEIFFNKYGGMALIMGRFLPIIRTFAPIFAGIVKYDLKRYLMYNIAGGFFWVFSLILAGFFIAESFPGIKDYLEYFILGIIIVTWIPVITTYLKEKKKQRLQEQQNAAIFKKDM